MDSFSFFFLSLFLSPSLFSSFPFPHFCLSFLSHFFLSFLPLFSCSFLSSISLPSPFFLFPYLPFPSFPLSPVFLFFLSFLLLFSCSFLSLKCISLPSTFLSLWGGGLYKKVDSMDS